MIEQADTRLREWASTIAGPDAQVALRAPTNDEQGTGVSLFLMELVPHPPLRGERRTPLQLGLRYLVTGWAPDPVAEHRLLGALVLAALREEDLEVQLAPPAPELWRALGASPRPSFVLQVPLRQPREEPARMPVRAPLVVNGVRLRSLAGVVVGPSDVPVAAARVEIPSAGTWMQTDSQGRFLFPGLPAEPPRTLVRVRARGHQMDAEIALPGEGESVVVHFDQLLED